METTNMSVPTEEQALKALEDLLLAGKASEDATFTYDERLEVALKMGVLNLTTGSVEMTAARLGISTNSVPYHVAALEASALIPDTSSGIRPSDLFAIAKKLTNRENGGNLLRTVRNKVAEAKEGTTRGDAYKWYQAALKDSAPRKKPVPKPEEVKESPVAAVLRCGTILTGISEMPTTAEAAVALMNVKAQVERLLAAMTAAAEAAVAAAAVTTEVMV